MQSANSLLDSIRRALTGNRPQPSDEILRNLGQQTITGTGRTLIGQEGSAASNTVNAAFERAGQEQIANPTVGERIANNATSFFNNAFAFEDSGFFGPVVNASGPEEDDDEEVVEEVVEGGGGGGGTGGTDTSSSRVTQFLTRNQRPTFVGKSEEQILREAQARFRTLFGDDPNFDSMLADYTETIRNIMESGRANIEDAKELADQRFGIAAERAGQGFREGQRSIAEQAFLGERAQQQGLIERGLGGSGISQLGTVQQRIAQGDQVSQLFSNFLQTTENLAIAEAESELNFSTAINQLNQTMELSILQEKQRIDGMRMQYNQWRGSTIEQLSQAARNNNIQDFQIQLQEWEGGLQVAGLLDQEARDAAQFQLELSREATESIVAGIEANPNLNRKQKDEQIAEARRNAVLQNNKIASSIGLVPEDFVSSILGDTPAISSGNVVDRFLVGEGTDLSSRVAQNRQEIEARRRRGILGQFAEVDWFGLNRRRQG